MSINQGGTKKAEEIRKLFAAKYKTTVAVDNNAVIRTGGETGSFAEYPLSGAPETWSREVLEIFEKMWKE